MRKRPWLGNLLKVLVSVGALSWVLSQIPFGEVLDAVRGANGWLLGLGYLMFLLSLFVRAGRWLVLLRGLGSRVAFWRLVELYFVGSFFNAFLPSGFGGDIVRAAEVTREVEGGTAVGTVLVDRLSGLMVLFAMALAVLPLSAESLPPEIVWPLAVVALVGLVVSGVLLHGGLLRRVSPFLERVLPARVAALVAPAGDGPVGRVLSAVTGCGWRAIALALAASLVFNSMLVGWWAVCGLALGLQLSLVAYVTFIPVLSLALMVPSIGGLGVREGVAPLLFGAVGVAEPRAVALSLVVWVLNRGTGIVGGVVYLATSLRDLRRERNG
jgi:uncharacterized membrane protein YbhN (UPF0104 family)